MSIFLVVHWWVWLAIFLMGALVGLATANLLSTRSPDGSPGRRVAIASMVTPLLIMLVTGAGAFIAAAGSSADDWGYLAAAALIQMGAGGSIITFAGGLLGALAAERLLSE